MKRALIIACAASMAACSKPPREQVQSVPVRIASVERINAPVTVSSNGVVEPLHTVAIEAQIGGILTNVSFREGDEVEAGQTLFQIDPRPLEAALRQARATLARDEAQAISSARDAERYRTLAQKDYVTKSQADQADASAAALRSTVQADSAAVENAQLDLAYATIHAPISGRTGGLLVRQGNLVKPGTGSLVVINQIKPILVRFPVPQRDFLALAHRASGRSIIVRAVTADSQPLGEKGILTFIDNAVDSLTGTVTAKAEFQNVSRTLWPGAFVRITVQLDEIPNAIAVPAEAVMTGQSGNYVYVVDSAQRAQVKPIKIGRTAGERVLVDSGLVVGEHVVIDGQSRLAPGVKIDVQKSDKK